MNQDIPEEYYKLLEERLEQIKKVSPSEVFQAVRLRKKNRLPQAQGFKKNDSK